MKYKYKYQTLNHIIYNLYHFDCFDEMILQMVEDLKIVVPNCCACMYLIDAEEGKRLQKTVCLPVEYEGLETETFCKDNNAIPYWLARKRQTAILQGSEMIESEEFAHSEYYKQHFEPYGVFYSIYVILASHDTTLGMLALYRKQEEQDFDDEDYFWLEMLSGHLKQRLYQEWKKNHDKEKVDRNLLQNPFGFTFRELEIMHHILQGKPNAIITKELSITQNTLKKHLQNMYRKAGVKSRLQLIIEFRDYK